MVPRKHRVPKAVAPAKTGSTRKMQRKKKRERKKKAATPHPLLCCAALKPVHHYHHNATRIVRHKHDTLTRNLSRARVRHVHVHLTDSQVGRRNRWSQSVKQGRNMRQKVGIQVPQFVPMQRFFFFFPRAHGKLAVTHALFSCDRWSCRHSTCVHSTSVHPS